MAENITIFWFRRDLRLQDNAGLYHALKHNKRVLPLFIFDKNILDRLEDKKDARVSFIHQEISRLHQELADLGSTIETRYGTPLEVWERLLSTYTIDAVYTNRDYEPYAKSRDEEVAALLKTQNIPFHTFKDHVLFEKEEVVKKDGKPYTVFTPYSKMWKKTLLTKMSTLSETDNTFISYYLKAYPTEKYFHSFYRKSPIDIISLNEMGFESSAIEAPKRTVSQGLIKKYDETRNFPAINGTSKLGVHFRFGTISVREKAYKASLLNETYLNELIWRDFYAMILHHFPHVATDAFRAKYEHIEWRNEEAEFKAWCDGQTGYPIVDAGMRELNTTGHMHNRVRMIVASFLTKHLLIDWRWGEAYFAKKLLDFDLASNNGGWQWAAGTGTDAAPYFRVFNPYSQTDKFDKQYQYIKKWVPEFDKPTYVKPIVEHKFARERCLETYKKGLAKAEVLEK